MPQATEDGPRSGPSMSEGGRLYSCLAAQLCIPVIYVTLKKKNRTAEVKQEMVSRCAQGPGSLAGGGTRTCIFAELQSQVNIFSWCLRAEPCVGCKVSAL